MDDAKVTILSALAACAGLIVCALTVGVIAMIGKFFIRSLTGLLAVIALASAASAAPVPRRCLVELTADWCHYCNQMKPAIGRALKDGFDVRPLDIDKNPGLAAQYHTTTYPSFFVLDLDERGATRAVVGKHIGAMSYAQLRQFLKQHNFQPKK